MNTQQQRIAGRQPDPHPELLLCSLGYVPRYGQPARRARDCPINCGNHEECDKMRLGIEWEGEEQCDG